MKLLSGRSFFLEERRKRKVDLLNLIGKNKKVSLNKLKGVFSQKTGLSFKKIDEYLEELHSAGFIQIDWTLKTVKAIDGEK